MPNGMRARSSTSLSPSCDSRGQDRGAGLRTILIIDDEPSHAVLLSELLADRFRILTATDGEAGIRLASSESPDLVLLDVRLPRQSGLVVCSALRQDEQTRDIPIIVMTGHDNQEARTMAYRMGADDYLSKPFSLDEMLARVESKMRRVQERETPRARVELGNLVVDRARMEASIDGATLMLSALEFKLLEYFVDRPEQILSRDQILEDVWKGAVVTPRTVDTHISFIRKKLANSHYGIRTIYGAGYILRPGDGTTEDKPSSRE